MKLGLNINLTDTAPPPASVPAPTMSLADAEDVSVPPYEPTSNGEVCELCIGSCMNSEECDEETALDLCLEIGDDLADHMCETTMKMGGAVICTCGCNILAKKGLEKVRMEYFV